MNLHKLSRILEKVFQRLFQKLFYLRFLLFQRHRHDRLVLETVAGKSFLVLPQVFNPALFWTSEFFAETLNAHLIPPDSRVLDLGTGSGINGVFAAQWAQKVLAVDLNPAAVRCARINALLNQVEDRMGVRLGDLFAPVQGDRFDVILFNPPFFKGEARDALGQAFFGTSLAQRFADELPNHLKPGGVCLLILSTSGDEPAFLKPLASQFEISILAQRALISETITIYQLRKAQT